jgi:hypothetical protein
MPDMGPADPKPLSSTDIAGLDAREGERIAEDIRARSGMAIEQIVRSNIGLIP